VLLSPFVRQRLTMFISTGDRSFIERLAAHLESGEVVPAIQSRYALDDAIDGMRHLESGTASGKTVIHLDSSKDSR
jgi:NADPH:quinone reductase-like Zn-dependent oxidoreductase